MRSALTPRVIGAGATDIVELPADYASGTLLRACMNPLSTTP